MYKSRQITVIIPALNEAPSIAKVVNGLFELHVCSHCQNVIKADLKDTGDGSECETDHQTNVTPLALDIADDDAAADTTNSKSTSKSVCNGSCNSVAVVDQVIVGNNGSTDDTAKIASACGAIVMEEPDRGYGAACLAALAAPVDKDLIVFVDADHSVVPQELPALLDPLFDGADLVIGSRTLGHCEKGALSIPQEIGNKLAIALLRLLWRGQVTDLGPFRAITQSALSSIQMTDRKFGWTVEMQIRALQLSLTTVEVPVSTRQRIGKSKISGTVKGVIGAAHGILGTIAKLYWRQLTGANPSAANDSLRTSSVQSSPMQSGPVQSGPVQSSESFVTTSPLKDNSGKPSK